MAVTVTDNRTTQYEDGLTGVTGADTSVTDFFAEATGCAAVAYNIATGQIYYGSSLDTTAAGSELLYVWSAVVATQNGYKEATPADSSHAQYVGDGTNNFIVYQAGNDRDVFKHADTQVSFQCFLIDMDYLSTADTNGDIAFLDGSLASLNEASITRIGAHYTTLSKALGGGQNCYMDIIRSGGAEDGIQITGGTTGDRGTFAEVAAEDRSTANGKAHGILREYTTGSYGCQGTMRFGDTGTATTYFEDDGVAVSWEDRLVADDKYKLVVEGNGTGTNLWSINNSTISSARPALTIEFDGGNVDTLSVTNSVFLNTRGSVTWSSGADASGHTCSNNIYTNVASVAAGAITVGNVTQNSCTYSDCGQIVLNGTGDLSGCTINRTANATSMVLSSNTSGIVDECTFVGEATNKHALELTAIPTSITWNSSYDSNFASGTTGTDVAGSSNGDEVIYINPGAANSTNITITVSDGSSPPSIRKGSNYTGQVNIIGNTVSVTVNTVETDGTDEDGVVVLVEPSEAGTFQFEESITSITRVSTTATATTGSAHGLSVNDQVVIRGVTNHGQYNGVHTVLTVPTTTTFTYAISSDPGANATGTLEFSFVLLYGTTSGGTVTKAGIAYGADQGVKGTARKSSSSPYFQPSPIVGTLTSSGFNATVTMVRDE